MNKKFRTVELDDDGECLYELAYDGEKGSCFVHKDILRYVNEHYLKKNNIIEEDLPNNLNTFETYRDDIEQIYSNQNYFNKVLSLSPTCVTTIFGAIGNKGNCEYKLLFGLVIVIIYINMIYNVFRAIPKSEPAEIKSITDAIYIPEATKEDTNKEGNSGTKSDEVISSVNDKQNGGNTENITNEGVDEIMSSVNDKLGDTNTEDIITEDVSERYEGLEFTEVKEIRTYTHKATKNEYSPRAMYEKKKY